MITYQQLHTMETIKIFLAGAKNLQEERLKLKALANALTFKYGQEGKKVTINMSSYEDFGDRQSVYDNFIKNEADIVIFLFDQRIGDKTEAEIRLAYENQRQKKRPEIYSFVRAFDTRTPEIDHMEEVLNTVTENYYVDFFNTEDLISKAKERLCTVVNQRLAQRAMFETETVARNTSSQTPMFRVVCGVFTIYYIIGGVAWMLFYSSVGVNMGLSLKVYLAGILLLSLFWIIVASLVGRHDSNYNARQETLVNDTEDVRSYIEELKMMAKQYGRNDTERLWKQLIMEAESIPPRQFARKKVALQARATQLINA